MPTYLITLPAGTDTTNPNLPDRLATYFSGKGYQVLDGAAIYSNGTALVTLDRDPSADAAGYANALSLTEQREQQSIAAIKAYVKQLRAITPASNRSVQQNYELGMAYLALGVFDGS